MTINAFDERRGGFDTTRPPEPDLIEDCVHCGFCLPTCPTYALWGEEMDSPRGRILLMRAGHEEEAELADAQVQAWDNCLGCMACVTACPSGVQYDKLIEDTRAQVERRWERPRLGRARRGAPPGRGARAPERDLRALPPPRPDEVAGAVHSAGQAVGEAARALPAP